MTFKYTFKSLCVAALFGGLSSVAIVNAQESSRVAPEVSAAEAELSFWDMPLLEDMYVSTAPHARQGTVPVGKLAVTEAHKAELINLAREIGAGEYGSYDSLLISHKGKLVFESYFLRGRVNLAHGQASATKGHTSLILGRAMQLGYLGMDDLNRPLIDFLGDVDRTNLAEGIEKITLHKMLTMHSGLNIDEELWEQWQQTPEIITGQKLAEALLKNTVPITDAAQVYQYGNFNPILIMMVIDAVVPGGVHKFIETEFLSPLGITNYYWRDHPSGLPEAGWRVGMTSRDMLKFGDLVLNDGKLAGEQFIPAAYLERATGGLVKPAEDWIPESYRYGYFWYHTPMTVDGKTVDARFAWGGGGQRVIVIDDLDLTVVITGHDGDDDKIMAQIEAKLVPAFVN